MMLQTFLDVLLVEEIPVENSESTGLVGANGGEIVRSARAAKKPNTGKILSCDTKFPMGGMWVDMPYKAGDVVRVNEFGRDYIVLNPEDEFKPDATKYFLVHYADIQGLISRTLDMVSGDPSSTLTFVTHTAHVTSGEPVADADKCKTEYTYGVGSLSKEQAAELGVAWPVSGGNFRA